MGLKRRIRRIEEKRRRDGPPEPPCGTCGGAIFFYERLPDGSLIFPQGDPCPECWENPKPPNDPPRPIQFIEIVHPPDEAAEREE